MAKFHFCFSMRTMTSASENILSKLTTATLNFIHFFFIQLRLYHNMDIYFCISTVAITMLTTLFNNSFWKTRTGVPATTFTTMTSTLKNFAFYISPWIFISALLKSIIPELFYFFPKDPQTPDYHGIYSGECIFLFTYFLNLTYHQYCFSASCHLLCSDICSLSLPYFPLGRNLHLSQ